MPKGFLADRADVMIALYGHFLTEEGGPSVSVPDFKRKSALLLSTSYISLLLESLLKQKLVDSDIGSNEEDVYTLIEAGVLRAEAEVQDRGMTLDEFEVEYRRRQNSGFIVDTANGHLDDARAALTELAEQLTRGNDLGEISADEREVALSEVSELHEAINKPRIRTSYLWAKANEALFWIIEKGARTAISELAKKALSHIHAFINVFFN